MAEQPRADSLRTAVERTFAATAEGAAETRERAGEMLDEVARRGREARETVAGRAQEARESSAGAASRVIEAIEGMRLASREDVRALSDQVEQLSKRVAELEAKAKVES
ncbi:MAG: phasin family protein [Solirubrobacterales bacterium]